MSCHAMSDPGLWEHQAGPGSSKSGRHRTAALTNMSSAARWGSAPCRKENAKWFEERLSSVSEKLGPALSCGLVAL